MDVITMVSQKSSLLRLKQQYVKCCCISLSILLLGLIAAVICNYGVGSAYLAFIVSCILYAAAIVYQILITVKAASSTKKVALEESDRMNLNKFTFRMCSLVLVCSAALIAASFPLITLPWSFSQQIIAVGWLESAWLPSVITIAVCSYVWWFLDTTAIAKGYWKRQQLSRKVKQMQLRYFLAAVIALLAVLLIQLVFNCIPMDTLAGGNTYRSWDDFVVFMEQPQDEWGNHVDRWLDDKTRLYTDDGNTVLCEYVKMNFSIDHITYSDRDNKLPVTVYTNRQMKNAQTLKTNANLFLYALYIVIPLTVTAFYFWKRKNSR